MTYAEGQGLGDEQLTKLRGEMEPGATRDTLFVELQAALKRSAERVRALAKADLEQRLTVGKKMLPTTVGGLLVHIADHTQRHVGQAITTSKIIVARRG